MPPFKNERQSSRWKLTVDVAIADANGDLLAAISGVKVSRLMFPMIHRDHDAKKAADLWHRCCLSHHVHDQNVHRTPNRAEVAGVRTTGLRYVALADVGNPLSSSWKL